MTRTSLIYLAPLAIFMTACSPTDSPAPDASPVAPANPPEMSNDEMADSTDAPETPEMATDTGATTGGDGSEITLQQVTSGDVSNLKGEIGCAFTTDNSTSLMVARADVGDDAHPSAAVNNNGYGEMLTSSAKGGFGALESDGGKFSGKGLTVTVTPGDRAPGDETETVTQSAELLVQWADGAERTYQGDWVCGP